MQKFVIVRTKEDNIEILYVADSKADAMSKGEEIARIANRSDGLISLEQMEVDDNNKPIGNRCKIFKTWRL